MEGFDYSTYPIFVPNEIPKAQKRKIPIWNVVPGTSQRFAPVQSKIVKFGTHWIAEEKRTVFCAGDDGNCLMDHKRQTFRWCGYLMVYMYPFATLVAGHQVSVSGVKLLHITPGAVRSCPHLDDDATDLATKDVIAWRDGETKRAEVKMDLDARRNRSVGKIDFNVFNYIVDMFSAPNNDLRRAMKEGGKS